MRTFDPFQILLVFEKIVYMDLEHIKFKADLQKYLGIVFCSPFGLKIADWTITNSQNSDHFIAGWIFSILFLSAGILTIHQSIFIMEERDYALKHWNYK